jgi:hypothetical protein
MSTDTKPTVAEARAQARKALDAYETAKSWRNAAVEAGQVAYRLDALLDALDREDWIPVGERLPDEWAPVLVAAPSEVTIARLVGGRWEELQECLPVTDVTHWRPLLEPPKPGGGV